MLWDDADLYSPNPWRQMWNGRCEYWEPRSLVFHAPGYDCRTGRFMGTPDPHLSVDMCLEYLVRDCRPGEPVILVLCPECVVQAFPEVFR